MAESEKDGDAVRLRVGHGNVGMLDPLYQARDLKPTIGLDSVIASAAGETFGIDPDRVSRVLFPHPDANGLRQRLLRG